MVNALTLKLPRKVEADPRHAAVVAVLNRDLRPLWEKGTIAVPHLALSPAFEKALVAARDFRQLERGLERIEQVLESEKKGLEALRVKQGAAPANRVSRLLIVANDGSERFYRGCESLLTQHADRLLCLRIDAPNSRLAESLLAADKLIKALLISEKDGVANTLLALA